jgi:pimeloyl-ACP methyl ester carboxylesterase
MRRNRVLAAAVTLLALLGSGAATQAIAAGFEGGPELVKEHLIDIGQGRHRNLICVGTGSPTVVFEQGTGSQIIHWGKVAGPISSLTRACFYDRAGYGFSDPPDRPMTLANVADDLHALLARAGIIGPFVLVGHSLGGFYATYYADRFASDVAGMVLVDPSFADMYEFTKSEADGAAFSRLNAGYMVQVLQCGAFAREEKLSQPHGCFSPLPATTDDQRRYMDRFTKPFLSDAIILEMEATLAMGNAVAENTLEERAAARSFGAMPLIVLTAERPLNFPLLSAEANLANAQNWKRGHDRLAARSTRGESLIAAGAGHFIQLDTPQAVIDAIGKVVMEVRRNGPKP